METKEKKAGITVTTTVNVPVEKAWEVWTEPKHIMQWNNASEDWHTPHAENDLREGGKFLSRMAARDGSASFNFEGTYNRIIPHELIEYTMDDGRKVKVSFTAEGSTSTVTETFDPENTNSIEMQRDGWQSILNNYKQYTEDLSKPEKLHFEIHIHAPVHTVYTSMIDEKDYREWTKEFNATSHYKGSWEKGAKIHFIGADEHGKTGGMVSRIRENIKDKYISIEHLGLLEGDREIMSGPEVAAWAGALENYTFTPEGDETRLHVDMDSNAEMKSYFEETWPKALNVLKTICERKTKN